MNLKPIHLCGLVVFASIAATSVPSSVPVPAPPDRPFDLEQRLEALDPARPLAYLELAEELADTLPPGPSDDRAMARRLYGLAGRLDPDGLAASAALGLASLASDDRMAARYRAAAALLDPEVNARSGTARPEVDLETAFEISEAFGAFRSGRAVALRRLLADPTRERLIRSWDDALPGGVEWLRSQVDAGLRNEPSLTRGDTLAMVRVELALLDLGRPSWSTLLAIDADPPIIDLRPERVPEMLLDEDALRRPVRRAGAWRER